ncbi:sec-independent protein translocase protein TatC [Gammaproteobacteria bacterium]
MLLATVGVFFVLLPFANSIYTFVAAPLIRHMPAGTSMIATEVTSPFLTPFKLTFVVAAFITMPYLLFQAWAFIAPGLYQRERKLVLPLMLSSILLFYLGVVFAYYLVFPLIFAFLTSTAPEGVAVMTDINHYLNFVLTLFLAFGITFEVPVAIVLLCLMGVVSPEGLAGHRRYVILGAFVIAAFLTPPDAFSQTLLAVPMWLLYEVGIAVARYLAKRESRPETPQGSSPNEPDGGPFVPLAPDQLERELLAAEEAERALKTHSPPPGENPGLWLERVQTLRAEGNLGAARMWLYQVLEQGDEDQRRVARHILTTMDGP